MKRNRLGMIVVVILLIVALGTNGYLFLRIQQLEDQLSSHPTSD